jgi:multicomponent Na+:H+ antiporter subunit C
MTVLMAATIAVLFGAGTYLVLQRALTRIVLGLALLAHAANLLLLEAGGMPGLAPIIGAEGDRADYADPLPQALALTAIVISFGMMAFLVALAYRSWFLTRDDEVEDDVEDRRIARRAVEDHERARQRARQAAEPVVPPEVAEDPSAEPGPDA